MVDAASLPPKPSANALSTNPSRLMLVDAITQLTPRIRRTPATNPRIRVLVDANNMSSPNHSSPRTALRQRKPTVDATMPTRPIANLHMTTATLKRHFLHHALPALPTRGSGNPASNAHSRPAWDEPDRPNRQPYVSRYEIGGCGNPDPSPEIIPPQAAPARRGNGGTDDILARFLEGMEVLIQGRRNSPSNFTSSGGGHKTFKPQEIGLFEPAQAGESDPVYTPNNGTTVFTEVNGFIQALQIAFEICDDEAQRLQVLARPGRIDHWLDQLWEDFKPDVGTATTALAKIKYTFRDLRNNTSPAHYVLRFCAAAKIAGTPKQYHQLTQAHGNIQKEMRRDIRAPTPYTTREQFIADMTAQKPTWIDLYINNSSFKEGKDNTQQNDQRSGGGNRGQRNGANRDYASSNGPSRNNRYYNNTNDNQHDRNRNDYDKPTTQVTVTNEYDSRKKPDREREDKSKKDWDGKQDGGRKDWKNNRTPRASFQTGANVVDYDEHEAESENDSDLDSYGDEDELHPPEQVEVGFVDIMAKPVNIRSNAVNFYVPLPSNVQPSRTCKACKTVFTSRNKLFSHYNTCTAQLGKPKEQNRKDGDSKAGKHAPANSAAAKQTLPPPLPPKASDEPARATQLRNSARNAVPAAATQAKATQPKKKPLQPSKSTVETVPNGDDTPTPSRRITKAQPAVDATSNLEVLESTAKTQPATPGFAYRQFSFAEIMVLPSPGAPETKAILDTGCGTTYIRKDWFTQNYPHLRIQEAKTPLVLKGFNGKASNDKYAEVPLLIPVEDKTGKKFLAKVTHEVRIADQCPQDILIGADIITKEDIVISLAERKAYFRSHGEVHARCSIRPRHLSNLRREVFSANRVEIPPRCSLYVPIQMKDNLPEGTDLEFQPLEDIQALQRQGASICNHMVDATFSAVQIRNDSAEPIVIPRRQWLGTVQESRVEGCYQLQAEDESLAALTTGEIDTELEHKHSNGATIYGEVDTWTKLNEVVDAYPTLFGDRGSVVDVPEERYMRVPLVDGWQDKLQTTRSFKTSTRDQEFIDETFDELHAQDKMAFNTKATEFGSPVFVTWRTLYDKDLKPYRKSRVVVDIRGTNKISRKDSYPVPLQSDLIACWKNEFCHVTQGVGRRNRFLRGRNYITVVDAVACFYQWQVAEEDREKFTVNTHRGQEHFKVAVMGYCNSVQYVQRELDNILRDLKHFAWAYIDDLVIASETLEEHVEHLHKVFTTLSQRNITLNPKKSFIGYPTASLLGQRVDALGYATATDRMAALRQLSFPTNGTELVHYLGLTGWVRSRIPYYSQITAPLQEEKVRILQDGPNKGGPYKSFASKARVVDTPEMRQAFEDKDVQPIMFLSKQLTGAEPRSWPTEMEGLMWTLKKVKHMVDAARKTIAFTDHSAVTAMAKKSHIATTVSPDRLNTRLATAAQYLSQFVDLEVVYRPGRIHRVPDQLSRLLNDADAKPVPQDPNDSGLDELTVPIYHALLVDMTDDFRTRLREGYAKDGPWAKVLALCEKEEQKALSKAKEHESKDRDREWISNRRSDPQRALNKYIASGVQPDFRDGTIKHDGSHSFLENGLIYCRELGSGRDRLCIPPSLVHEVFEMPYDRRFHPGYDRTIAKIKASVFIRDLATSLRNYLNHCLPCVQNQTRRHAEHGELRPLGVPRQPMAVVAADFVTNLPPTADGFDTLLVQTDKMPNRVMLVPGKSTWKAPEWAQVWLVATQERDWSIPVGWISDMNKWFMSEFFKRVFQLLGTRLFTSTAYHPQTDGQSERTIQTVNVALRYFTTEYPDHQWSDALPRIQSYLNTSPSATTGYSPHQIVFGFNCRVDAMDAFRTAEESDYIALRQEARDNAYDAMVFATAQTKTRYDSKHKPIAFKFSEPVRVTRVINDLAYELDIPPNWGIHNVVSVVQLEPAPNTVDPYNRPGVQVYSSIDVDKALAQSEAIERILDHRQNQNTKRTQYCVNWANRGPSQNQ
ncbi:unnamed protein product [Zymoseptoria tritici ST99CH_1A5]|uniref:RNA-directed DNA polymerase n=1 Tax=Zymoseptoria tritici ST99CH_1A5 TaxID=1276529 RepID=A0A1Y6M0C9_ZYMTR|nr:unnamed protein product [Zymoseptoria tritici ST99CH_1A5]